MKKTIAIILIGAHLVAVFHFTMPYLNYYANFSYFATELCVNQDHPDLNCNGTCQLDKMLQQHDHHQDDAASHHVDRAPKADFFFQEGLLSFSEAISQPQYLFATDSKLTSLWQSEPPSPPPQII